ncbi:hypothetical protein D0Z07_7301 [Hyphodiscus hymeniophilus]|uniref:Uncharacterized protein n=1 Tax=Hyphodiscus hymeniophilus TaxID=353542 RepID=A0A9P6VFT3_9HELO|nr:hypothetical protein D0Z07_7301 [Hyphodiscus hymeniophilus]
MGVSPRTLRQGGLQRLFTFLLKPLLAALFVTLIFHWTSKPAASKNPHPNISKALVIASTKSSNLTWLPSAYKSHWKPHIYVTDDPRAEYTVPINKGNEAMVYLTYIIDHYSDLPDVIFFHHDHHQAWHQIFSSSFELSQLNPLTVQRQGYVSPRCLSGCENIIELPGDVAPLDDLKGATRDVQISTVLHEFMRDGEGRKVEVPKRIAAPCCAQFAVSKEAILRRPLEMWVRLRKWLIETPLNSRSSGRVLEYTWHLWFGMEDVFCPAEEQCLCNVFGLGQCPTKDIDN